MVSTCREEVEREVEGWRTLSLRVLGILEDLVDHEPCVGVFLELQSELAGKRLSVEEIKRRRACN
jgi:hypothetical protein